MAGPIPLNPDLPASYALPGVYGYISLLGTGPTPLNRRVLFFDYKTSAGTAVPGVPVRVNSEQEVVSAAGKGSNLHRWYKAFLSQGGFGSETWICPMVAPSGTAQTRVITITGTPTDATTLSVLTAAASAGILSVWICGYRCDVTVANGDTYATIATNLVAEINKVVDFLPCTAANGGTATVTLTMRHAALTSADLPIIVSFSNTAMSVSASPGTLTFATNAGADGSATTFATTQSASSSFTSGDTAAQIADGHNTAINAANLASAFPLTSCCPAGAVCTLFYVNDRVWNWGATSITTAANTTITAAWGTSAAGLPSSSSPTLAQALTNIAALDAFKLWVTSFTGAGSVTTSSGQTQTGSTADFTVMGTISSKIESQANGLNCKGQVVVFADTRALTRAGGIPTQTSPALTASPRYFEGWCPASPQQAGELAARMAARVISQDYLPQNYAGMTLTTDGSVPLLLPHTSVIPSDSDVNSAIVSYYLTALRANSQNQLSIVSGRTTAKPGADIDIRFVWWGTILTTDYFRDDLRAYLAATFKGKSIKRYSAPVTTNCVTVQSVTDTVFGRMLLWDGLDFFDGAERLKDYLNGAINSLLPSRIDINLPIAEPVPLEQISLYLSMVP